MTNDPIFFLTDGKRRTIIVRSLKVCKCEPKPRRAFAIESYEKIVTGFNEQRRRSVRTYEPLLLLTATLN